MKDNLLRFNNKQKYILFDFETCSLNLGSLDNKPWQLSFLIQKSSDLPISEDARRITRFNEKKYKKESIDPIFALKEFEKYLYDPNYLIVGHNILGFDVYIHGILRQLCGFAPDYSYIDRCVDTNCLARGIKNKINFDGAEAFVAWQYKLLHHRV